MKIIVTGASGFIGRHCVKLLFEKGYEIHAISSKPRINEEAHNESIVWYEIDLFDLTEVQGIFDRIKPDYFMHLAWKMQTGLNLNYDENEEWLSLSKSLINIFYNCGGKRVLVSGSCFEYDLNDRIISEKTPLIPNNKYGSCKMNLFNYLNSFSVENELSYVWARIFFTYGPGQKDSSLVPYVISRLIEGKSVETTDGNQQYDYLYVEDIANALILLLESSYIGPVNVSSGKVTKLKDFINKIASIFKKEDLISFGSKPRPKGSPDFIKGKNELLRKITNWKQEYTIDEGINKLINYKKSN